MHSPGGDRFENRASKRLWLRMLLTIGLVATLPTALGAQGAKLQGLVTGSTGAIIPGAQVTVTNSQSGVKTTSETNGEGQYTVPFLQPGDYELSVGHEGFKTFQRSGLHLDLEQTAAIDVTLQPGTVNETVKVTDEAPLLQTQTVSVGQTIDNKTVITLPLNGRDYTQLVTLAAGAAPNNHSRASNGFSLNGSQNFQNTMLLDGVDNNNYILGADSANMNAVTPSIDAIQEFQVETSNYSAQYGRSAGGIVSVSINRARTNSTAMHLNFFATRF